MTTPGSTPNDGHHDLSSTDTDDLFASPSRVDQKRDARAATTDADTTHRPPRPLTGESRFETEQAREVALQKELAGVRSINEVIGGVSGSLERAKGNMEVRMTIILLPLLLTQTLG